MDVEEPSNSSPKASLLRTEIEEPSNSSPKGDITCLSGSLIGIKREKFEDIYDLYCSHALEVGFSVRKSSTKYNTAGVVVYKCLVCSCEGTSRGRTSSSNNGEQGRKRATSITRTNCKASLRVKVNVDGFYEVVDHNTEHNHVLSRREWSYMHRSQRSINTEKTVLNVDPISFGMRAGGDDDYDESRAEKEQSITSHEGGDDDDDDDVSDAEKEQSITCHEGDITCLSGSLIGIKREKFEDIYDLYCNHALEVGFSVRRSSTRYNSTGVMVSRCLVCSCEGTRRDRTPSSNNEDQGKKRTTNITRSNCKALLRVKLNSDGFYEVTDHNTEHNHTLSRREWSHMHLSQRSSTGVTEDMISSGMKASDSFRYMAHDARGEHVIGQTKKHHLNYVNRMKINAIEGGDAQALIDNLYEQGVEDQEFFFRVKLDDNGRLCNVFWRDSMMKEDYTTYGDVVVFNTTYRTNKYNLICAPFVGVNNHQKNVMFGCAFISSEKTGSFEWLFEAFKKSMGDRSPVTLFTDEDQAIANSVQKVFPTTRHRLCIWHLDQNAPSRLEKLKSDKCFSDAFEKCLTGCTNEEEFENCWSSMISNYGLQHDSWFQRLYDLREKWCTAYNKDFFSGGILSSQRSESMNNAVEFNAQKTTNLKDFYIIFKKTVECWRSNEANDELQCSRGMPTSCLPMTGLVKHASEVYTLALFKDFEKEFLNSISTSFTLLCEEHGIKLYHVSHADNIYQVSFYAVGSSVTCSCKRFEECGLLCCHCLRILHTHSVDQIPECYIKKRWTKLAKRSLWDKLEVASEKSKDCSPWRHHIVRKYYNLSLKAQEHEEDKKIFEEGLNSITSALEASMTARKIRNEMEDAEVSSSSIDVRDPSHSITKGRRQRVKGHFQKSKKNKTCDASNSNQSEEFGSETPNPGIF